MSTIIIKYAGTDITDRVVFDRTSFKSSADGNVGSCTIVVDDHPHAFETGYFIPGGTIELFIDGTREWDGWITTFERSWPFDADDTSDEVSVPRFWTLTGSDRNLLFLKRVMYDQNDPDNENGFKIWPADTWDKTAILYALEHYVDLSGDSISLTGIKHVDTPGPYEEFTLGYLGAPFGALFEDCSKITGAVYFIGPDRVLYYVDDMDVTAPFSLSDTPTGNEVGYREVSARLDFSQAATEALVWGAGIGSDKPVFQKFRNQNEVDDYGLWQWGEVYVGAWKQATVNKRARTYINGSANHRRGHGTPVPVVSCTIFEPGIRAGQVVDFQLNVFDWGQPLPVRSMAMSFPTPTLVRYDLELSLKIDQPFGVPDLWPFKTPEVDGDIGDPQIPGGDVPGGGGTDNVLIDHFDVPVAPELLWWADKPPFYPATYEGQTLIDIDIDAYDDAPEWQVGDLVLVAIVLNTDDWDPNQAWIYSSINDINQDWHPILQLGSSEQGDPLGGIASYRFIQEADIGAGAAITIPEDNLDDFSVFVALFRNVAQTPEGLIAFNDPPRDDDLGVSIAMGSTYDQEEVDIVSTPGGDWETLAADSTGYYHQYAVPPWAGDFASSLGVAIHPGLTDSPVWDMTGTWSQWQNDQNDVYLPGGISGTSMVTPGPDRTGSQYAGGNPYTVYDGDRGVENSEFYFNSTEDQSWGGWIVRDFIRTVASPQGVVTDPEPDTYPQGGWSQRGMLLFKFRFTGDTSGSFGIVWGIIEATDGEFSNKQVIYAYLYWNDDGEPGRTYISLGNDAYFNGDNYEWYEDYGPTDLVAGTDYYLLIDFATEDRIRMKYWAVGDAEPGWAADLGISAYPDDGAENDEDYNEVDFQTSVQPGESVYLDAWWVYQSGYAEGQLIIGNATYEEIEGTGSGNYQTQHPYQPGTLAIYDDGIRLRPGVDYVEVEPENGTFRIIGGYLFDLSPNLSIRYVKAGEAMSSPSGVYRPAPCMMGGWLTPLDGYNATLACSVMALERHTLGAHSQTNGTPLSTPPEHRSQQNDQSGEVGLDDVATAWSNGWGEDLHTTGVVSWSYFVNLINDGRGAILLGEYDGLPSYKRFGTKTGRHALYINDQLSSGNFYGFDPAYGYGMVYTPSELQSFAEGLAGSGNVLAGYTKVVT